MAEPSATPTLPSTADTTPYVPVSWMAVGAMAIASLFVIVLVSLGISAFLAKKPLVQPELLAFPAIGIVVSFAARRVIRNSEGTRTGERLAVSAWWICVIAGLGYAAYLLAIDYAVRRDAKGELQRWMGYVVEGEEKPFNLAFLRTRDPARRTGISADNTGEIRSLFPDDYIAFEQSDIVRLTRRNKGSCLFIPTGVKEWMYRPFGVDCLYSGILKCPEGTFPIIVPLRGTESTSAAEGVGRQWTIANPPGGYIARDQRSITPYGWLLDSLEASGVEYGSRYVGLVASGPLGSQFAYHTIIGPEARFGFWQSLYQALPAHVAAVGGLAMGFQLTPDYGTFMSQKLYTGPRGAEPTVEQRQQFKRAWEGAGLFPAGARLRNSPDNQSSLTITDSAVEVRLPCELPFPSTDGNISAARARLVVSCSDPAVLAEIKQLRSEANPDRGSTVPPDNLRRRQYLWKILRIESDMVPVRLAPDGPGSPGAPNPFTSPLGGS